MSRYPTQGSPLRQAMIAERSLRNYAKSTTNTYVGAVARLSRHYNRCPSRISDEEVVA